jgi:hypothetical protein
MRATVPKMRRLILIALLGAWTIHADDPSRDVIEFFQTVTSALAEAHPEDPRLPNNASAFLEKFDRAMPGYADLSNYVEDLVSRAEVGSAVEFVSDKGDNNKRQIEIDWVLEIGTEQPRRKILTCTIERRGKKWKITALAPVDFFKY